MASMCEPVAVACDPRIEFLSEYTLKALRLKPDKWARLTISDEQRLFLGRFIEGRMQVLFYAILTNNRPCFCDKFLEDSVVFVWGPLINRF